MTKEKIERTFDTGDAAEVSISNVDGKIEVQGWSRPEVVIRADKYGNSSTTKVDIGQDGKHVWAKTHSVANGSKLRHWFKRGEESSHVDYSVHAPYDSSISISGVSGPVHVTDFRKEVNIHSVNGQINLNDLAGNTSATTVNGSIEARHLAGSLSLESVSGRAEITNCRLELLESESVDGSLAVNGRVNGLRAEAVNGSVDFTGPLTPDGLYEFRSVNGRFQCNLPTDTNADIVAAGLNLSVSCDLPHTIEDKKWGQWNGQINEGQAAEIRFNTVNGSLSIGGTDFESHAEYMEAMEHVEEVEPDKVTRKIVIEHEIEDEVELETIPVVQDSGTTQPLQESVQESTIEKSVTSKMDILKAIEVGDIRVEDALEQLRNLN